jgi:MerR family copper efflux transcriptional regulator
MPQRMQMGAAEETGLTEDAIRFYEKAGLIKGRVRGKGCFRLFRSEDLENLKFIRKLQELGFSLAGGSRTSLSARHLEAGGRVRDPLERKLAVVREKLHELRQLESSFKAALRKCDRKLQRVGGAPRGILSRAPRNQT